MTQSSMTGMYAHYGDADDAIKRLAKVKVLFGIMLLGLLTAIGLAYGIGRADGWERGVVSVLVLGVIVLSSQLIAYFGKLNLSVYFFFITVVAIISFARIHGAMNTPGTAFTSYVYYSYFIIVYMAVFGKTAAVLFLASFFIVSNFVAYNIALERVEPLQESIIKTGLTNSVAAVIMTTVAAYALIWLADKRTGDVESKNLKLTQTSEDLHDVLARIQGVTESLSSVADRIAHTSSDVSRGAESTASSVEETGSSMHQMLITIKGVAESVQKLAESAKESSSSISDMTSTNEQVVSNIQHLSQSMDESATAIEKMTLSIKEVARSVEELSSAAEETSSSMNQMDVSINQVENNANETAKLSEEVSVDAGIAGEALRNTIDGIDKIKDSSKTAASVIKALGEKISKIGNILNVIDEVAEQTNLLALNAAIIAAQAGEHGKGFAVVADEIKDLAERTGSSTKEISELIRAVQDESGNAISAMERGVKNVEEGVRLSGDADTALKKILDSAGRSTQMVKAIARATVEQARGSKQVTSSVNRIAQTVQAIAGSIAEQARGSEQIMKFSERMKAITRDVERSSQEQARGSKQIKEAIDAVFDMAQRLNHVQREQASGAERVMAAMENIRDYTSRQNLTVKDLESAVDTLAQQSDVLRSELHRFKGLGLREEPGYSGFSPGHSVQLEKTAWS